MSPLTPEQVLLLLYSVQFLAQKMLPRNCILVNSINTAQNVKPVLLVGPAAAAAADPGAAVIQLKTVPALPAREGTVASCHTETEQRGALREKGIVSLTCGPTNKTFLHSG